MRRLLQIGILYLLLAACGVALAAPRGVAQKDLFFGDGGPGPYPLAWTAVVSGTESVFVDGRRLLPGLDYVLDTRQGTLRFPAPLERGQVVQVEYRIDGKTAKPNRTALQSPFALTVLERGSSQFRMLGAMRQGSGGFTAGLLGFSAETRAGGAALSGLFLAQPAAPPASPLRGGDPAAGSLNWQETGALRLNAEGKGRGLQYRAAVTQAGAQFAGAPQLQTPPGLRRVEVAAAYQPSKQLSIEAKSERTDALVTEKRAQERELEQLRLTYQPSGTTTLRLSQETSGKTNAAGVEEETTQSRVQLDQKFGLRSQATALFERVARSGTAQDDTRERIALSLQTRPTESLSLTTRAEQTSSEREGDARSLGLGAEVRGPAGLTVGGGYTRTLAERSGARTDGQLRLALKGPLAGTWDLQRQESDRDGQATASRWSLAAGGKGWLKLSGIEREQVRPDGASQAEERYRLEATPIAAVKLGAEIGARETADQPSVEHQEASLQLVPGKALSIGGSLRNSSQGETSASVTSVTGALTTTHLDVGGHLRQREIEGGPDLTTRDLQLALRPADWLKLTGRYTENPEDKRGVVQEQVARSLGLQTRVGSVTLGGSVTEVEAFGRPYEKQQMELRLTLNFSKDTALTSAYQATDERGSSSIEGRTYSLGFRHSVGSQFYLKLEGEVTTFQKDGISLSGQEDTRANIGLGLRF